MQARWECGVIKEEPIIMMNKTEENKKEKDEKLNVAKYRRNNKLRELNK